MNGSHWIISLGLVAVGGVAGVLGHQFWKARQASDAPPLPAASIEELASSIESSVSASMGAKMDDYLDQMRAESSTSIGEPFPTEELTTAIIAKLEQAVATGELNLAESAPAADAGDVPTAESGDESDSGRADVAAIEFPDKQKPIELAAERELQQIHFIYDSADLTPGAQRKTRLAAESIVQERPSKVQIQGFSDTVGNPDYNEKLSQRRAASVAKLLVAAGVPAEIIEIEGMGESVLPEPTGDGVQEPLNRCVSIRVIQ